MSELDKQLKKIKQGNHSLIYLIQGTEQYLSEKVKIALMDSIL